MDDAEPAVPDTLTIELAQPIEFQKGHYDTLVLHEPTARQMLNADGQMRRGVNAETLRLRDIHLVAAVSGWPVPVIEKLPISRLDRAVAFLLGFTQPGLPTGES